MSQTLILIQRLFTVLIFSVLQLIIVINFTINNMSMLKNQKPVRTAGSNSSQKPVCTSFSELSVSSIKQKLQHDQSFDAFCQQKMLLNQIEFGVNKVKDQYGLEKPTPSKLSIKKDSFQKHGKALQGNSRKLVKLNFQKQQNNLCFNKNLKRKKALSKSKQKLNDPYSFLSTYHSSKQLKFSNENGEPSQKYLRSEQTCSINEQIQINMKSIKKTPKISLDLCQQPLNKSIKDINNKDFNKIYYLMPDDFKVELNDLNFNLNSENRMNSIALGAHHRKQAKSLVSLNLKRSHFSKPETQTVNPWHQVLVGMAKPIKKSVIYQWPSSEKVIEVSKPLSLDCKNTSIHSSRTEYQSPISVSKQSTSTGTRKLNRRSEIYRTGQRSSLQYFQALVSPKNAHHL